MSCHTAFSESCRCFAKFFQCRNQSNSDHPTNTTLLQFGTKVPAQSKGIARCGTLNNYNVATCTFHNLAALLGSVKGFVALIAETTMRATRSWTTMLQTGLQTEGASSLLEVLQHALQKVPVELCPRMPGTTHLHGQSCPTRDHAAKTIQKWTQSKMPFSRYGYARPAPGVTSNS
eukprot:1111409-Amphidinium_carterae.1